MSDNNVTACSTPSSLQRACANNDLQYDGLIFVILAEVRPSSQDKDNHAAE